MYLYVTILLTLMMWVPHVHNIAAMDVVVKRLLDEILGFEARQLSNPVKKHETVHFSSPFYCEALRIHCLYCPV